MIIEVAGKAYAGWVEASATISLAELSNTFSFKATSEDGGTLPFTGGEPCKVKVDGEKVLTGNIEIVNVDGETDSHTISISGRDKTGDIVDSKIGSISDLRPTISLETIIKEVLKHIKSPIRVVSQYYPTPFVESEDLAAPEFGQDAWEFIEKLARKRQVLLTSNANGDLVITRSSGVFVDVTLQNKINNDDNNVLSYSVSYDTTGIFSLYRTSSQQNPIPLNKAGSTSNYSLVEQISAILDPNIRAGRQHCVTAENAGSRASMQERNKWEYNIRKARSQTYSATVHGFRNSTGNLWAINQIINVDDEFAGIKSRMLVNSVQFSLDEDGRQTVLSLVHKDAYTLELPTQTSIDKLGEGLVTEDVGTPIVIHNENEIPAWVPWTPQAEFGDD